MTHASIKRFFMERKICAINKIVRSGNVKNEKREVRLG